MPDGHRDRHFGRGFVWKGLFLFTAIGALCIADREASGQPTNAEVFGQLASNCIGEILTLPDSVALVADQTHPFIRPAVVASLHRGDVAVFADRPPGGQTGPADEVAVLSYAVDGARVRYLKGDGDFVERHVALRLSYTLLDNRRAVTADSSCSMTFSDDIDRGSIESLEDPLLPVTVAEKPDRGWLRRYAEPAVVAAASAVVVYLFFNVRSDRKDNE